MTPNFFWQYIASIMLRSQISMQSDVASHKQALQSKSNVTQYIVLILFMLSNLYIKTIFQYNQTMKLCIWEPPKQVRLQTVNTKIK